MLRSGELDVPYRPFGIFRTLLAFLVLLQHIGHAGPADMTLGRYATGSIAVLVFFTLSGFVITEAADRFYRRRPWAFLANRAVRILPQYLAAIAVSSAIISMVCLSSPDLLPNKLVTYTCGGILAPSNIAQNILMILPGAGKDASPLIPYVWALRVEVLFYFILTIGLIIRFNEKKYYGLLLVSVSLAIFALSIIHLAPYSFQYTPYFLLGVVAYFTASQRAIGAPWLLAPVFATCLWTYITHSMPDFIPTYRVTSREGVLGIVLYCVLNGVLLLLVYHDINSRWRKVDSAIGELSFPLYLQQYAALVLVIAVTPRSYMAMIAAGIMACVFATLAALVVERPIRSFRDRVRGSRIHFTVHGPDAGQPSPGEAQIGTMQLLTDRLNSSTPTPRTKTMSRSRPLSRGTVRSSRRQALETNRE